MIKAVIFDFFGVLVGDGFTATYISAGGDPIKDRLFVQALLDKVNRGQISTDEFRKEICNHLGITLEQYVKSIKVSDKLNNQLFSYIKNLKKNYKTAILSNVTKGGLEKRVDLQVLKEHFDTIVASGEVGYIKPEPEIYHLAAKKLGVQPEECIFIDDRQVYVEAAEAVGMKSVWYKDFGQMKKELERLLAVSDN